MLFQSKPTFAPRRLPHCSLLLVCLLACTSTYAHPAKHPDLPEKYAHWLHDDVNYLITHDEQTEFLALQTDTARDRFIDSFWLRRDPDRNGQSNPTRDEHYRRLAYSNEHFGSHNFGDGIHSDRGMVYITLGPPQQREVHPEAPHLRPIEIWFYQNSTGDLPTHFYVLFYRPDFSSDFRLYSPYIDRPEKLVNGTDAVNNDRTAIHIISNALNVEAAHVALSLIPGEPVDLNAPRPSLQSDVLLNQIRDFRNLPSTRRLLDRRRTPSEEVSHRLLFGAEQSDLTVMASRDGAAGESLHYLFNLRNPRDFSFGQRPDGASFYALRLKTELLGSDGQLISDLSQELTGTLDPSRLATLKQKTFAIEGRLPVAPGKYQLRLTLTNTVNQQQFQQTRAILVPAHDQSLALSQILFTDISSPTADSTHQQPFSFSGVKISPRGAGDVTLPSGSPIRIVFQVWEPPADPALLQGATLDVHYLIGQIDSTDNADKPDKLEEDQKVDRAGFDPTGNLLLGKQFSTEDLAPGNYRLVVRANNPATHETAYQALNFSIAPAQTPPPQRWTVLVPPPATPPPGTHSPAVAAAAQSH